VKHKLQNNTKSNSGKAKRVSQLERANAVLKALAKDVTTDDRQQIIDKGMVSEPTLIQYLRGNGSDLDKLMALIRFIRERIETRDKELAGVQLVSGNKRIA
jgi:hypothetical protein